MTWFMLDTETDGSSPGNYSMLSFGCIVVDRQLDKAFYGKLMPISDNYNPNALKVNGISREEALTYPDPRSVMDEFVAWVKANTAKGTRSMLISDNNGFDAMFMSYYMDRFHQLNPFGHSSTNLGSLYKGLVKDTTKNFKHLRVTRHTHNPIYDARGNCEALFYMIDKMGLHFPL